MICPILTVSREVDGQNGYRRFDINRYEEDGLDELIDKRLAQVSWKVLLQGKKVGRRGQGKRPSSVKITPRDAG